MKLIDAIGLALIILGAAMTALCFLVVPVTETKLMLKGDAIFYDIPPQNYYDYRYQRAALITTNSGLPNVPSLGYRMGDWAICHDGTAFYERNEQYPTEPPADPPCTKHGGLRSYGPGRRLNEK